MRTWMLTAGFILLCSLAPGRAQEKAAAGPAATITLGARHARAVPHRQGFTHTGGGNLDVSQPAPDTVVLTMTGVAVAGAHPCKDSRATLSFELTQCFEVALERPELKQAKLTVEARGIGLLRSHCGGGSAQEGPGVVTVSSGPAALVTLSLPAHSVTGGQNESVNDREGPVTVTLPAGKYTLHQTWTVGAAHPRTLKLCKAASAEFAPDPALDPLWISHWEPFHGAAKKDLGFQVTIKVAAP